jgi:hypothetical protein
MLMADIISLDSKFRLSDAKKAESDRQRKTRFIQKFLRRLDATAQCEKCGVRIVPYGVTAQNRLRVPYHFCDDCAQEYIDYIEQLKGNGNSANYWHNSAWQKVWRAWIDYQSTIDQYLTTKEFKKLIKETKP